MHVRPAASAEHETLCCAAFRSPPSRSLNPYPPPTYTLLRSLSLASGGGGFTDGKALDIISVTTLEVRDSESSSYVAIAAGDTGYYLQPGDGAQGEGEACGGRVS